MSAGYNGKYIGLTTIGLGSDADLSLLRTLSEQAGGNFYFVENPSAVSEVFTQELAFFVAPIAYDLQNHGSQAAELRDLGRVRHEAVEGELDGRRDADAERVFGVAHQPRSGPDRRSPGRRFGHHGRAHADILPSDNGPL